jgi:hypothetical protein
MERVPPTVAVLDAVSEVEMFIQLRQ